jgi:ABC-type phosphate transport system permease subunit
MQAAVQAVVRAAVLAGVLAAVQMAAQEAAPLAMQGRMTMMQSTAQRCTGPLQATHHQQQQQQQQVRNKQVRAAQMQGSRLLMKPRSLHGLLGWDMTSHTC